MAGKVRNLAAVLAILLLLLIPVTVSADSGGVLGTEYVPEEDGTIYVQVLNGDGTPANGATVTLTLWKSDGTKELDGVNMDYIATSDGIYQYDFTSPADDGVYVAAVSTTSPTGYGIGEVHVSSEGGGSASAIWEEGISGYTDTSTFGGILNDILGGGTMPMLFLLGILALGLIAIFFWKKSQMAAYGAAGAWILLGFQGLTQSTSPSPAQIQDTYMGLFWLCVIFTIACMLLPLVMREKPSKEDIYVDDIDEVTGMRKGYDPVTGEKLPEEGQGRRKRIRRSKFNLTGE